MPISLDCPDCGKHYQVGDHLAGKSVRCKACGGAIRIPAAAGGDDEWDDMLPEEPPPRRLPARPSAAGSKPKSPSAKKGSGLPLWVWIVGGSVLAVLLVCGGIVGGMVMLVRNAVATAAGKAGESVVTETSLAEARQAHPTILTTTGPSPQPYENEEPPPGVERITFRSGDLELFAWFAKPQGDGPFPAVLHCHGGFAFGGSDFDDARPYLNAGYAVLVPAWRGENGNPGSYELCFGEVGDAAAALDWLAARPDIDATRLFASGHSVGGTIAMLLAETSPRLRGAMACGGCPDMQSLTEAFRQPVFDAPYNWQNPIEGDLRSPSRHIASLKCPLALYFALPDDQMYSTQADGMVAKGRELGKQITSETVPGDHYSALAPAIQRSLEFFRGL